MQASSVWCWGRNEDGELGDGTTFDRSTPVKVYSLTAVAVSAGAFSTCALVAGGTVKCWGENGWGELGDGSHEDSSIPVTVSGLTTATAVSAGSQYACALLFDKAVQCWGLALDGTYTGSTTPVSVAGITTATGLATGHGHACVVLADTTVRCWGANDEGQLGDGTRNRSGVPVAVLGLEGVTAVDAGENHTCARLADNTVRCWGSNSHRELGVPVASAPSGRPPLDGVIGTLSAGTHQVCVRATDTVGNTSNGAACATLTVVDKTGPTVTAPQASLRSGVTLSDGSLRVGIGWTGTDNPGGVGIARYELERSTDGGTTWASLSTTLTSASVTTTLSPSGTRRYRVRGVDTAGNVGAWATAAVITPRLVQDSSTALTTSGTWSSATSTSYSGGTARWSSTTGASMSYSFTGTSVALVATTAPTRGVVNVYLDGIRVAAVDTASATFVYRVQVWSKTFASSGTHTLRLAVVGTTGRPRVDVDAIAVFGVDAAAPPPTTGGGGPLITPPPTATEALQPGRRATDRASSWSACCSS